MTDQTIAGCPWCGDTNPDVVQGSTFRWRVAVCGCGAQAAEVRHDTIGNQEEASANSRAAALREWNRRASPWRPIDEAPKDGQDVDVWGDFRVTGAAWFSKEDGVAGDGWYRMDGSWIHPQPTHFMLLPDGPSE